MLNFCTLFDTFYLTRGLTLYKSLKEQCKSFHLYILAFDDNCREVLNKLNLQDITVVSLAEFEDEELLKVKNERSLREYCWTCKPSIILYILKKYRVDICTFLDADLFFYDSPEILIKEIPETDSVMITEHRFTEKDLAYKFHFGIYCSQLLTFKNNENSLKVLTWWRAACIEWCYDKFADGKFGDQKYLNNWPAMFQGVYVLKNLGGGVGPWNVRQYNFFKKNNVIYGREKSSGKEFKLIFYHFTGIRFTVENFRLSVDKISGEVKELIYKDYLNNIKNSEAKINELGK